MRNTMRIGRVLGRSALAAAAVSAVMAAERSEGALVFSGPGQRADGSAPPHQAEVLCEGCSRARWARLERWPMEMGQGGIAGGGADANTDVLHYNLGLEIVPATTTLIGTNAITVKSNINGLTNFGFQLRNSFTITSVKVDGVAAAWTQLSIANVDVTLPVPRNAGQTFVVEVSYNGVPVSLAFGSINFTTQNGQPLIFTLSEPWYAYSWWPVKEDSNDKATADMAFTVPNTLVVCSNGVLQGTDVVAGGKLKYRWRTNYPTAPYLFSFSATNYAQFSDTWVYPGGISMPMNFFIYPADNNAANRNAWLKTKEMLSVFSDKMGTYGFADEKYGIYQFGFGGGMEHQTMTGQGTFDEGVTAHELGHQWWGDTVTCGTWSDIWLNEGSASYCEALWFEFKAGGGFAGYQARMAARKPFDVSEAAYVYDTSSPFNLFSTDYVYNKGAWVLHMLRHVMGDTAFFQGWRDYRTAHEYGTATTADFEAAMEGAYGSDLGWFIEPWVMQPGAINWQYGWRNISAGGQAFVELYLKQTQSASYPTYRMPVDVRTTISAVNSTKTVWNDARTEHLLIPVSGTASAISVDPDEFVLTMSKTTTGFVEGPPKVTATVPAAGTVNAPGTVGSVSVVFHKNVNATANRFSLNGQGQGNVAFNFSYSAGTKTATLTPTGGALGSDVYTVTVDDLLTETTGGIALDGEVVDPMSVSALPSGDGLSGGDAVVKFTVASPVGPGDVNEDGTVDIDDLTEVILAWGPCGPPCAADLNADGDVDIDDLTEVILNWE